VVNAAHNDDIELHPSDVIERVLCTCLDDEDVAILLRHVEAGDGNTPIPENIPINTYTNNCQFSENWGHRDTCYRRMDRTSNNLPAALKFPLGHNPDLINLFENLFLKNLHCESNATTDESSS
jgi:hypothetical protein